MKILSFDVGIINLAYCIFDSETTKLTHWEVITLNNLNANKKFTDYNKIYINLINELDARPFMVDGIDIVLIEKQPSFNPKMRVIAGCLQTYFIIRGIVDLSENPIKEVTFFSPKHKLKCYNGPELVIDSKAKGKYALTKKMGVLICQYKLKEYSESSEMIKLFNESKKKDDLSDCYLQAITYSMFEKIVDQPTGKFIKKKGSVKIPKGIKTPTKTEIKKQLKDYLDVYGIDKINDLSESLKSSIKIKYSINIDSESIKTLLNSMNMKKYLKN